MLQSIILQDLSRMSQLIGHKTLLGNNSGDLPVYEIRHRVGKRKQPGDKYISTSHKNSLVFQ